MMSAPLRRLVLLSGILLMATPAALVSPAPISPADQPLEAQSRLDSLRPPEVRLRKLHLVRPDLISYPLLYEVVC